MVSYARSNSDSSCSSTVSASAHQLRYQNLLNMAQSGSGVTNADLAIPSQEPPQYKELVRHAQAGRKFVYTEDHKDRDDTSSIVSMKEFIAKAEKSNVSRRQAVAIKIRQWSAEGKATWKRVQPYYEDFKWWVMLGPH